MTTFTTVDIQVALATKKEWVFNVTIKDYASVMFACNFEYSTLVDLDGQQWTLHFRIQKNGDKWESKLHWTQLNPESLTLRHSFAIRSTCTKGANPMTNLYLFDTRLPTFHNMEATAVVLGDEPIPNGKVITKLFAEKDVSYQIHVVQYGKLTTTQVAKPVKMVADEVAVENDGKLIESSF